MSFLIAVAITLIRSNLREEAFVLATVCQSGRGVWTQCLSGRAWWEDTVSAREGVMLGPASVLEDRNLQM